MGIFTKACKPTERCADLVHAPLDFKVEKVVVTAKPRALKAEYTIERPQPMLAMHGGGSPRWIRWLAKFIPWIKVTKSVNEEIADILAEEIRKEVDAEILAKLKYSAPLA